MDKRLPGGPAGSASSRIVVFSLIADGTAKFYEFREPTPRREPTVTSEDLSGEIQGEAEESQVAEPTDDAEASANFWSIQGEFIYRHYNEPRFQLNVPKEETFPIPLKYIDVTRSTHTDLDLLEEKRIDEDWKVDSRKQLSNSWKGFTQFNLSRKTCKRICGRGG